MNLRDKRLKRYCVKDRSDLVARAPGVPAGYYFAAHTCGEGRAARIGHADMIDLWQAYGVKEEHIKGIEEKTLVDVEED